MNGHHAEQPPEVAMLSLPLVLTVAIVFEDHAALRAQPRDLAPRQAELARGDWLEVRGERPGYLQVRDHRRERPGYVRTWQVRVHALDEAAAPALLAAVRMLRDAPGFESLGIGYAALYLRAAPPADLGSEVFDALGVMAERLARRASRRQAGPGDAAIAAQLDVAASYGVRFVTIERPEGVRTCYDGEAFQRVLAASRVPAERARAALALTRRDCLDPAAGPVAIRAWNEWRARTLAGADPAVAPAPLGDRLRLRRAEVQAEIAYDLARRGQAGARAAATEAVRQLALVARGQLLDEDLPVYDEAAVRVGAVRWATAALPRNDKPPFEVVAGRPGESCLRIRDGGGAPFERCTYGLVWKASARQAAAGPALVVAVQPLPAWTELWVIRRLPAGWQVDVLPPLAGEPAVGYVEAAGFAPDGSRLLVVREAIAAGRLQRTFQVLRTDTLTPVLEAPSLERFVTFRKWASADWRGQTLALR